MACRWRDVPASYGPHKTIYNRFVRWSEMGVFGRIFVELAKGGGDTEEIMIDATHLKTHRTASSLRSKRGRRRIGRTKGGLNSKLHVSATRRGPDPHVPPAGQTSDYIGARPCCRRSPGGGFAGRPGLRCRLVPQRPDRIRISPASRQIQPQGPNPTRRGTLSPAPQDREHVRQAQGLAQGPTRYDRCPILFLSAIALAAIVIYWL